MNDRTPEHPTARPAVASSLPNGDQEARFLLLAEGEATFEGRLAAICLTLFPVLTGAALLLISPSAAAAIQRPAGVWLLLASVALIGAGGWWLWRIASPPFAAFPQRHSIFEREPRAGLELSVILNRAVDHANLGMDVVEALDHASPHDAAHPARVLTAALRAVLEDEECRDPEPQDRASTAPGGRASGSDSAGQGAGDAPSETPDTTAPGGEGSAAFDATEQLPDWLLGALRSGWIDSDPVDTLNRVALRLRNELVFNARRWTSQVRIAALIPFALCILPATLLLGALHFL